MVDLEILGTLAPDARDPPRDLQSMSEPVISVILPCYNLGAYLGEAIQSVLDQTVQDFEILVLDDGSTDAPTRVVLDTGLWPRTTLYRTENRGLAQARNYLIERARGRYLCALDADDRLRPTYFARALAAFDAEPDLAFVSSWIQMFGDENWVWRQNRCDLPALLAEDTVMTAALVRRDLVVAVGGYDEEMPAPGYEDWDLWIRIVAANGRGTILPELQFDYRRRPDSMSRQCERRETHLALIRYLMHKHVQLYAAHWKTIAARRDLDTASVLRQNRDIERDIKERLLPDINGARRELHRLEDKLRATAAPEPGRLEQADSMALESARWRELEATLRDELTRARADVAALRNSWSWRITGPLRAVYEMVRRPSAGITPPER